MQLFKGTLTLAANNQQKVIVKLKSGETAKGIAVSCTDEWAKLRLSDGFDLIPINNISSVVRVIKT